MRVMKGKLYRKRDLSDIIYNVVPTDVVVSIFVTLTNNS